jgi:hypothetical protein
MHCSQCGQEGVNMRTAGTPEHPCISETAKAKAAPAKAAPAKAKTAKAKANAAPAPTPIVTNPIVTKQSLKNCLNELGMQHSYNSNTTRGDLLDLMHKIITEAIK